MVNSTKVASVDEIAPGKRKLVEVSGRPIALINHEGKLHAIDNTCSHKGGPLLEGEIEGCVIECPWHGWGYDLNSGECTYDPHVVQAVHKVSIEGNDIFITITGTNIAGDKKNSL